MSLLGTALGGGAGFLVGGPWGAAIGAGLGGGLTGGLGLSKKQNQTVTTNNEPWRPQQPYLTDIFGKGQGIYNANPSGMNQATQMGVNALMRPDPNIMAGAGLLGGTLNGSYLNSNPYLDQTFNHAASAVGNNIAGRFAAGGRYGSGAMYNALGDSMGNLANDIYGGNYQAERGRQMQALGFAPTYANYDANRYLQAGQVQQSTPWDQLARYQGAISGNYGGVGTQTSPIYRNQGAGMLGGALAGAQLGGQFGNPLLGAVAGGLLGGIG